MLYEKKNYFVTYTDSSSSNNPLYSQRSDNSHVYDSPEMEGPGAGPEMEGPGAGPEMEGPGAGQHVQIPPTLGGSSHQNEMYFSAIRS